MICELNDKLKILRVESTPGYGKEKNISGLFLKETNKCGRLHQCIDHSMKNLTGSIVSLSQYEVPDKAFLISKKPS